MLIMLRSGRFKNRLLTGEFLEKHGSDAHQCISRILPLWKSGELTDTEMAAIYILVFLILRRPHDFLGGAHNQNLPQFNSSKLHSGEKIISLVQSELPQSFASIRSLRRLATTEPFLDTLCRLSWRSIPLAVARALMAWQAGTYPLQLLTHIPSPEEVLKMQADGKRCVSMLIKKDEISNFVENNRDVLGFIVHDLLHADHFFSDSVNAARQVHFSKKLIEVYQMPQIQQMLKTDEEFKREFHYLMSDMNSVPFHLIKTFKAILLGHFKRQLQIDLRNPLKESLEPEFNSLLELALEPWKLPSSALAATRRLNTPSFRNLEDSNLIESYL